ncbi:unnamed protein product [Darwinula stevensoni]|uniref:Cuticle protein CPCFC domain-containing protein n=1 Tax=Darwinula stevensoni TaxID=69355 RepID=A0A7R9A327_9CRUS|nr:unnamed protein product [Darwinula stevensoni]CAG0890911.1 unnamed protein product [Darwinula stevensoni]
MIESGLKGNNKDTNPIFKDVTEKWLQKLCPARGIQLFCVTEFLQSEKGKKLARPRDRESLNRVRPSNGAPRVLPRIPFRPWVQRFDVRFVYRFVGFDRDCLGRVDVGNSSPPHRKVEPFFHKPPRGDVPGDDRTWGDRMPSGPEARLHPTRRSKRDFRVAVTAVWEEAAARVEGKTLPKADTFADSPWLALPVLCVLLTSCVANPLPVEVPAGVSPAACPNYPICDPNVDPQSGLARGVGVPVVAPIINLEYPAGLDFTQCHNFPFCSDNLPDSFRAALAPPLQNSVKVPAGVNPAVCPNYPFCNYAPLNPFPVVSQGQEQTGQLNDYDYTQGNAEGQVGAPAVKDYDYQPGTANDQVEVIEISGDQGGTTLNDYDYQSGNPVQPASAGAELVVPIVQVPPVDARSASLSQPQQFQSAQYPADFDPASCPNFPFCHN